MPTVNISLPEPLREYVEARAERDSYSTSEFIRQLIREDKARNDEKERDLLWDLLAISAKELDDGLGVEFDVERLIAEGRERRASNRE